MSQIQNFLVFGATGRQGGAVVSELVADAKSAISASNIYAVTRDTSSTSSQRLSTRYEGIHLVQGDLENPTAIFQQIPAAVRKTMATYLVQPEDAATELSKGKAFIDAAVAGGIAHIVYSSVDRGVNSDTEASFVPQYQAKFAIEQYLKDAAKISSGALSYTIIRPSFLMENFQRGFLGALITNGLRDMLGGQKFQMTASRDIGRWAVLAMLDSRDPFFFNRSFSVSSDELTFAEADAIFREERGKPLPTTYKLVSAPLLAMVGSVNAIFRWMKVSAPGGADLSALAARSKPLDFRGWVRATAGQDA